MQKIIGLVGYVNKSELVINLAKTLSITGKKVLVIDGTLEERLRYTIPAFNNSDPTISPCCTSIETPFTTVLGPYFFTKFSQRNFI